MPVGRGLLKWACFPGVHLCGQEDAVGGRQPVRFVLLDRQYGPPLEAIGQPLSCYDGDAPLQGPAPVKDMQQLNITKDPEKGKYPCGWQAAPCRWHYGRLCHAD